MQFFQSVHQQALGLREEIERGSPCFLAEVCWGIMEMGHGTEGHISLYPSQARDWKNKALIVSLLWSGRQVSSWNLHLCSQLCFLANGSTGSFSVLTKSSPGRTARQAWGLKPGFIVWVSAVLILGWRSNGRSPPVKSGVTEKRRCCLGQINLIWQLSDETLT